MKIIFLRSESSVTCPTRKDNLEVLGKEAARKGPSVLSSLSVCHKSLTLVCMDRQTCLKSWQRVNEREGGREEGDHRFLIKMFGLYILRNQVLSYWFLHTLKQEPLRNEPNQTKKVGRKEFHVCVSPILETCSSGSSPKPSPLEG